MVTLITEKLQDQTLEEISTTETVRIFFPLKLISSEFMSSYFVDRIDAMKLLRDVYSMFHTSFNYFYLNIFDRFGGNSREKLQKTCQL